MISIRFNFSLMEKSSPDVEFRASNGATPWHGGLPLFTKAIIEGADDAVEMRKKRKIPAEDDAIREALAPRKRIESLTPAAPIALLEDARSLAISFRAAFSSLLVSFVDSAPSEIAVATLKNMNAIATWDTHGATDSTVYITVTSVQVDNMVPNSPFPVAICPFDQPRNDATGALEDTPPLLVMGLSFAPRHKSGIVVR